MRGIGSISHLINKNFMSENLQHARHQKTGNRKANKKSIRVDLTPMVDLGFLLISFFVFTTSIAHATAMKLVLPDDSDSLNPNEALGSKTLNLLLAGNNEVYAYNGDSLDDVRDLGADPTVLRSALMRKKNEMRIRLGSDSGMIVLIKPTPHATYRNVIDALDEMQICAIKIYVLMESNKTELEKIHQQ